jgi:DNA-binding MarR family transcriptional regulator
MNNLSSESSAEPPIDRQELAEIGRELRSVWHALMRGAPHPPELQGLQRQQFWVLTALAENPRRMSDLAECAETSQASLTGIVDRLEEQGLVQRHRSEDDRRVVEVAVTAEGREMLSRANAAFLGRLQELVAPLTAAERIELVRLMRKLSERGR